MSRRRFVCTPLDMARFTLKVTRNRLLKRQSWNEWVQSSIEHYLELLDWHKVWPDEDTVQAVHELEANPTMFNLHMMIHHVYYQLYDAYKLTWPLSWKVSEHDWERWKEVTEDCYRGN